MKGECETDSSRELVCQNPPYRLENALTSKSRSVCLLKYIYLNYNINAKLYIFKRVLYRSVFEDDWIICICMDRWMSRLVSIYVHVCDLGLKPKR